MAQKVQVVLVDDVDGGEASETVSFSIENVSYEIDLSEEHAAQMRKDFEKWTTRARRVTSKRGGSSRARRSDSSKVRAWAKAQGYEVSERGRISSEIREAYSKAN
ncbi:histone-like nucleoid-structuring protein Lsr2 [Demequina sp. SO4-13]|uniref:histone-like nucleoid-structuring protein Lsr2 n=1 Tax=Demequina sp. SO4-13 TaxID=3401027 RepID=UPI003AF81CDB